MSTDEGRSASKIVAILGAGACLFLAGGCGSGGPSGKTSADLKIDGSNTVFPIAQQMGEDFSQNNPGVRVNVSEAGTGSGFQKFIRGDIDIATASRPIETIEDADLKAEGVQYMEIPIAYDGVSVVVNPNNTWVDKLTMDELKKAWNSASTVRYWSDIRPSFPHEKINFYGPTPNHGTFEYFTEAVNGKKNDIRQDCQRNQDYRAIVQSIGVDRDGIAYMGYTFYAENKDKTKIVPVDSGKGPVAPSAVSISDGTYTPLSRPLFLYVGKKAYDTKPEIKAFIRFALSEAGNKAVSDSDYVVLPKELAAQVAKYVGDERVGTLFKGVLPGAKLSDLYGKVK